MVAVAEPIQEYQKQFGTVLSKIQVVEQQDKKIQSNTEAVQHFKNYMEDEPQEKLMAAYITTQNKVIGTQTVTKGSLKTTGIDNLTILRTAAISNASAVLICHNHPTGKPQPTEKDKKATETLKQLLEKTNVKLLDHIIIAENQHTSFKKEQIL